MEDWLQWAIACVLKRATEVAGEFITRALQRRLTRADSLEESGPEANLDLHQFGNGATGLCFCGD